MGSGYTLNLEVMRSFGRLKWVQQSLQTITKLFNVQGVEPVHANGNVNSAKNQRRRTRHQNTRCVHYHHDTRRARTCTHVHEQGRFCSRGTDGSACSSYSGMCCIESKLMAQMHIHLAKGAAPQRAPSRHPIRFLTVLDAAHATYPPRGSGIRTCSEGVRLPRRCIQGECASHGKCST